MKVRQDSWSHEDDLLLAETVLRHIREGSTQLNAFEEVGDKLNRTAAACGFRWNAEIRQKYDKALDLAKKQRKERKRALAKHHVAEVDPTPTPTYQPQPMSQPVVQKQSYNRIPNAELSIDAVIRFLENFKNNTQNSSYLKHENDRISREVNELKNENQKLMKQLTKLKQNFVMMQEDYQSLVQIMDRARRHVLFDEKNDTPVPNYQIQQNEQMDQIAE